MGFFEGLRPEYKEYTVGNGFVINHELLLHPPFENDIIVGRISYWPVAAGRPENEPGPKTGTYIDYLGYGEHEDDPLIPSFREEYPNLGLDLLLWVRRNLEPPFYALFANEELGKVLRAKDNDYFSLQEITRSAKALAFYKDLKYNR